MKPIITQECVKSLFTSGYISVFDLEYEEGKHYFDATRRSRENLVCTKSDAQFRTMVPDAVTCAVILELAGSEPKLLLSKEYRYPAGRFLLSPPAGLIDDKDAGSETPALTAAVREIFEETGLTVTENDRLFLINPLLFSSPGMTDESNALACAVIRLENTDSLTQSGAEGSECFDGFALLSEAEARSILQKGRDAQDFYYSVFTWAILMYFISGMWKD